MQPQDHRILRALARDGLDVRHIGSVWIARLASDAGAPPAEILLPDELPLEAKAVRQLAELAAVRHPAGRRVFRACATPDFHPGDSGVAIGSVVETPDVPDGMVIPAAVGADINCGMRLHMVDLTLDQFLGRKAAFLGWMTGDYLFGTRDVGMTGASMARMFDEGIPGWAAEVRAKPLGRMGLVDWEQVIAEATQGSLADDDGCPAPRVYRSGSSAGHHRWAPPGLVPDDGSAVRDDGLATIGRGNHFVEVQVVDEVLDRRRGFAWGLREGNLAFMIHSGSRNVGRYVGKLWTERAREAWPAKERYPASGIFPIADDAMVTEYLTAEATAVNYGFVNRALLAELFRLRLREVFGASIEAPLVYDLPHNITLQEGGRLVSRKGACPAHAGQPVIIPGSMGTPSFLCVGHGNLRFISSASHGAGRSQSRMSMGRMSTAELGLDAVECITLREERRVEEAPAAYKPIQPVINAQVRAGMIGVVARLRPVLTFKA